MTVGEATYNVLSKVSQMGTDIINKVGSWVGDMVNAGRNLIQGMIDGVGQMASNLINAVAGPVNDAIGKAKSLLGIHSPSRVFRQIGIYTGEGFVDGLEEMGNPVQKGMQKLLAIPATPTIPIKSATITGGAYTPTTAGVRPAGGGLTVNVTGQEEMSPDRFGRRVGEALAYQLDLGGALV
jgi:hypothetical protein